MSPTIKSNNYYPRFCNFLSSSLDCHSRICGNPFLPFFVFLCSIFFSFLSPSLGTFFSDKMHSYGFHCTLNTSSVKETVNHCPHNIRILLESSHRILIPSYSEWYIYPHLVTVCNNPIP